MVKRDPVDLVLEYGPEGNVENGRNCSVYEADDSYIKICPRLEESKAEMFKQELDEAGIIYPETDFYTREIPVYDIGEVLVAEQNVAEPALEKIAERPERYLSSIREIGLKAAANDLKLDISLDNLCVVDGELGTFDINDPESVWMDEPLALHLMGSHLLNSLERLERIEDIYAPELKELAHNWKKTT